MRAMLAQSDKLASIGLLSAGVAHEINNPLAYVANNLAVLERDFKGILSLIHAYEATHSTLNQHAPDLMSQVDAAADELDWSYVRGNLERMLSRTREGVQRVGNIVQNLRGLARTSPPRMEPVTIPDLIAPTLEMVQGRIKRRGGEVVQQYESRRTVSCVPSQISQVVLNLLVNAIQAIESSVPEIPGQIIIRTGVEGQFYAVDVIDNGPGVPAEVLPRLFDPFFTTKPVGEGTGLGLSISHGIVSGHGGRIEVENLPERGSRFRVLLPLSDPLT